MATALETNSAPQVALVGGTPDVSRFTENLEAWGVDVCAHIPYLPLRVPKNATHIVVFRDQCSHNLYYAAKKVAERRSLPLCAVAQSWAKAEVLLREHGVLPGREEEETKNPQSSDYDLRTKVVALEWELRQAEKHRERLAEHLRQAEDMVLERDEVIDQMTSQLMSLGNHFQALESKVRANVNNLNVESRVDLYEATCAMLQKRHGRPRGRPPKGWTSRGEVWNAHRIRTEAAKRAGFGSYDLAKRARKVFVEGDENLRTRVNKGEITINAAYNTLKKSV
jgi:hypothetical protein